MFCIAFTKKTHRQVKATCYAKASHQKLIRKKMMECMQSTIQKSTLKDLVKILVKEEIGKKIQKECYKIFPLEDNCMVRKVKILKKPKFDLTKLMSFTKIDQKRPNQALLPRTPLPSEWNTEWKFDKIDARFCINHPTLRVYNVDYFNREI